MNDENDSVSKFLLGFTLQGMAFSPYLLRETKRRQSLSLLLYYSLLHTRETAERRRMVSIRTSQCVEISKARFIMKHK